MKVLRFAMLPVALLVINSCTEQENSITGESAAVALFTEYPNLNDTSGFRDTAVLASYTRNYQTLNSIDPCAPSPDQKPAGYYVNNEDIRYMSAAGGVRMYFGIDTLYPEKLHLILAGVHSNGEDSLNLEKRTGTTNFSLPCPSTCDNSSPFYRCESKSSERNDFSSSLALMRLDSAIAFTKAWRKESEINNDCTPSDVAQVKGYWVSRAAIDSLVPPGSEYGIHIYFGTNSDRNNPRIFLIATRTLETADEIVDIFPDGKALLINKSCDYDNCNCSVLSRD